MKTWALILLGVAMLANAEIIDPTVEYRITGAPERGANGELSRSNRVIYAFRKAWACPSTGLHLGACPGWALDHVIPLACGGSDAVINMQWLPNQIKSHRGEFSKDHFERRVYGGNNMSKGCP